MKKVLLLSISAALALVTLPAQAQQNCAARATVLERLASKYGESRMAVGMATRDRVMEVFASEETGTWTLTVTMPNGITCLVASGSHYESVDDETEPTGMKI